MLTLKKKKKSNLIYSHIIPASYGIGKPISGDLLNMQHLFFSFNIFHPFYTFLFSHFFKGKAIIFACVVSVILLKIPFCSKRFSLFHCWLSLSNANRCSFFSSCWIHIYHVYTCCRVVGLFPWDGQGGGILA